MKKARQMIVINKYPTISLMNDNGGDVGVQEKNVGMVVVVRREWTLLSFRMQRVNGTCSLLKGGDKLKSRPSVVGCIVAFVVGGLRWKQPPASVSNINKSKKASTTSAHTWAMQIRDRPKKTLLFSRKGTQYSWEYANGK